MNLSEPPRVSRLPTAHETSERADGALRRNLVLLIGAGVIALFALVLTSVLLFRREQNTADWIEHTYAAESRIETLAARIEEIETARRGYLLIPDEAFSAAYLKSRSAIAPVVDDLLRFTQDNPRQTRVLREVQVLIAQKLRQYDGMVDRARVGDRAGALAAFVAERDQHVTRRLRAHLSDLTREEDRLLRERVGRQDQISLALVATSLGLAVLLIALGVGISLLLQRYAAALVRSQDELRQVNAGLETAVQERTLRLTRANEEIQRFAYIVSHDLRSPLVNVMGFTSELETALASLNALIDACEARDPALVPTSARLAVTEDLPEAIGFIRSSTRKMDRLINAILKLSREGRRTLAPEILDMNLLFAGVRDNMRQSIDTRGASVRIEADLPSLIGDRLYIEQIFGNLMENAVKYLRPGVSGEISVRGRINGDARVYEIQDNGRGIAAKDQERVFDLFRRAGLQDQPGEGIGLAHVRALVYRLGGTIDLESEPDRGSVFRVTLPSDSTRELRTE